MAVDTNKIRLMFAKATPAPWRTQDNDDGGVDVLYENEDSPVANFNCHDRDVTRMDDNAALVVHLVNTTLALCDELDKMHAELDHLLGGS